MRKQSPGLKWLTLIAVLAVANCGSDAKEALQKDTTVASKETNGSAPETATGNSTSNDDDVVAELKRLNPARAQFADFQIPSYSAEQLRQLQETYGSRMFDDGDKQTFHRAIDDWLAWRKRNQSSDPSLFIQRLGYQVLDYFKDLGGDGQPPGQIDSFEGATRALYWSLHLELIDYEDHLFEWVYRTSLTLIRTGNHNGSRHVLDLKKKYGAVEPRVLIIRTAYNAVINRGAEAKRDQAQPQVKAFLKMPLKKVREQVENRLGMTAYQLKIPSGLIHVGNDLEVDYFIRRSSEADAHVAPEISVKAQIFLDRTLEDERATATQNGARILAGKSHGKGYMLFTEFPNHGTVKGVLSQRSGNRRLEVRIDWKGLPESLRPNAHKHLEKIFKSFKFEN